MAIIGTPTPADDVLTGTNGNDVIDALPGNDRVNGLGGKDRLLGNFGNDTLSGGADDDTLDGGFNNDIVNGDAGNDVLNGGDGDDKLAGGAGNNRINGGAGRDVITVLSTSPGDAGDTIDGGAHPQVGSLGDELQVEGGSSYFLTSNTLTTGGLVHKFSNIESVWLTGNTEDNLIDASQALVSDRVVLNGNEGKDTLKGSQGDDQIYGGRGHDRLEGNGGFNFMRGWTGDDTLVGGNDGNSFYGEAGNDLIQGGAGRDSFRESASDGAGDDRYIGGGGDDYVAIFADTNFLLKTTNDPNKVELIGGALEWANITDSVTGTDTLEGIETIDIQGGSSRTKIYLSDATQNLFLKGGGGGDEIRAGSGNDFLTGSFDGNDNLAGGDGRDILDGRGGFNTEEIDRLRGSSGRLPATADADRFVIGSGYRGHEAGRRDGHAVIADFRVEEQDEISLGGSANDYTFVQKGIGLRDTYIYFGSPANNDIIAILERVTANASTPGINFSS